MEVHSKFFVNYNLSSYSRMEFERKEVSLSVGEDNRNSGDREAE